MWDYDSNVKSKNGGVIRNISVEVQQLLRAVLWSYELVSVPIILSIQALASCGFSNIFSTRNMGKTQPCWEKESDYRVFQFLPCSIKALALLCYLDSVVWVNLSPVEGQGELLAGLLTGQAQNILVYRVLDDFGNHDAGQCS